MNLILIILASAILIFQFLLDFLLDYSQKNWELKKSTSQKIKIYLGVVILIAGLATVWISFSNQENDRLNDETNHKQELVTQHRRFDNLDSINTLLKVELKLRNEDIKVIRIQNDSLRNQLSKLGIKQDQFLVVSQFSAQEVSKSRIALENMGYKQISRGISMYDKIEMIRILKIYRNSRVVLTTIMGDSEAFQFATQIKEVFETAGWKVDGINQAIYNKPITGVNINVGSYNYPLRVDNIFSSFKVLNITAKGNLKAKLQNDDVELIIGAK